VARGPSRTTIEDKVSWLAENTALWTGIPAWPATVPHELLPRLEALGEAAVRAGLYSAKTYRKDLHASLRKHLVWAQKRVAMGGANADR